MLKKVNPAGPRFENRTDAMIKHGITSGNIGKFEAGVLKHQDNAIKGRVASDLEKGLNPTLDPVLARMQVDHRKTTQKFLNFNPGQEQKPGNGQQAGRGQSFRKAYTFTDKEGNEVTRTPDGYTYVEREDGTTTTLTPGGYAIDYNSEDATLSITDTRSGESTEVWGDPHVSESDEDGASWDYDSATSTFVLSDGTKITTNAESAGGTLTSIDIYSGTGGTHISNSIEDGNSIAPDRWVADYQQDDGDVYFGNRRANDWYEGSPWGEEVQSG